MIKKLNILLYILCLYLPVQAQDSTWILPDSTWLEPSEAAVSDSHGYEDDFKLRLTDTALLSEARTSSEYDYNEEVEVSESLYQRFWRFIDRMLRGLFSQNAESKIIRYVIILIMVILVVAILMNTNLANILIGNRKKLTTEFDIQDEDIDRLDFDKVIAEAIAQSDYRRATRYLYLKLLKLFSQHELISWKLDKTNYEYIVEMNDPRYKKGFAGLTRHYEYMWYGNFEPSREIFDKVYADFKQFTADFERTHPVEEPISREA